MNNLEQWKPVQGFPRYQVSSFGRVWSEKRFNTKADTMLKPRSRTDKSLAVHMRKNGKTFDRSIHRLVAEAFLPDWDPALQVDHRDGDRSNNELSNLRMATSAQNNRAYCKPNPEATSRFRGVGWFKARCKWKAQIGFNGRRIFVGHFTSEIEAARARDAKAIKLGFLPEALNFPNEIAP